jgi:hypothetical protein
MLAKRNIEKFHRINLIEFEPPLIKKPAILTASQLD